VTQRPAGLGIRRSRPRTVLDLRDVARSGRGCPGSAPRHSLARPPSKTSGHSIMPLAVALAPLEVGRNPEVHRAGSTFQDQGGRSSATRCDPVGLAVVVHPERGMAARSSCRATLICQFRECDPMQRCGPMPNPTCLLGCLSTAPRPARKTRSSGLPTEASSSRDPRVPGSPRSRAGP